MSRTKYFAAFFLVLFLVFSSQQVVSADDLDLLNALDQEMSTTEEKSGDDLDLLGELEAAPAEKKEDRFKYLTQIVKNLEGSLQLRGHYFYRKPDDKEGLDKENPVGDALLRFNTWTGGNTLRLDLSGWLEAGSQQDTYEGIFRWPQDRDSQRHYLELNELYLTLSQDTYDVTVGKKIFQDGISTLFSPADRYRPADSNDPLDPKDFGIWQTRADYYLGKYTFTAMILPVFNTGKTPSEHSRWSGAGGDYELYGEDISGKKIEEDFPAISINNVGYFARAKTTLHGWDLFASAYHGLNSYHVLREETRGIKKVAIKENVKVGDYAAGFSTTYKKFEFHGEGLFNLSYDGKDDNYINLVGGLTYTIDEYAEKVFLEKIDITIEYAREEVTEKQSATGYTTSSRKGRLGRNNLFTRINFKYNEDLSFQYVSDFEFNPSGRYNRIQSKYKIREGLEWILATEFFNGKSDSYYGRWKRNDRLITSFKYSF
ncbi:MAG: hypothetical protein JRD43_06935 [Deltaproteobacteria bacterium]|nr:hypothetical protein [Deltaproteobacteria bacterium]MBW2595385.1 hypothetical protein [Deltaproteobacteria bacterium]